PATAASFAVAPRVPSRNARRPTTRSAGVFAGRGAGVPPATLAGYDCRSSTRTRVDVAPGVPARHDRGLLLLRGHNAFRIFGGKILGGGILGGAALERCEFLPITRFGFS